MSKKLDILSLHSVADRDPQVFQELCNATSELKSIKKKWKKLNNTGGKNKKIKKLGKKIEKLQEHIESLTIRATNREYSQENKPARSQLLSIVEKCGPLFLECGSAYFRYRRSKQR